MKLLSVSVLLTVLLVGQVSAMDLENLQQIVLDQEVPREILFVNDNDIINVYVKSTGSFIFGVQLEGKQVKSILNIEEKAQVHVYITLEALDEISSSEEYTQKTLEHYQRENIIIEPKTFTGQIKYKFFVLLNKLM